MYIILLKAKNWFVIEILTYLKRLKNEIVKNGHRLTNQ